MMRTFIAVLLAALVASASAAEVAGVKLDEKLNLGGQDLVLNGAGIRSRAIFKVYVASLYVPVKVRDLAGVLAATPRRVQLDLLRNVSAEQLVDALNDGLRDNNSEAELAAIKPEVEQLATIMRSLKEAKEHDVVALDYVDGSTRVSRNGEAKGSIAGEAFNRALMKVWLGERPVQGDLKKAMLGG